MFMAIKVPATIPIKLKAIASSDWVKLWTRPVAMTEALWPLPSKLHTTLLIHESPETIPIEYKKCLVLIPVYNMSYRNFGVKT